jgi:hypothetical protein
MWKPDKLREIARQRGEDSAIKGPVAEAILFHERWQGRTEERYPREKARAELERILAQMQPGHIPVPRAGEFAGLTQLRNFVRARAKETMLQRTLAPPKPTAASTAGDNTPTTGKRETGRNPEPEQELVRVSDGGRER